MPPESLAHLGKGEDAMPATLRKNGQCAQSSVKGYGLHDRQLVAPGNCRQAGGRVRAARPGPAALCRPASSWGEPGNTPRQAGLHAALRRTEIRLRMPAWQALLVG